MSFNKGLDFKVNDYLFSKKANISEWVYAKHSGSTVGRLGTARCVSAPTVDATKIYFYFQNHV